MLFSCCHLKLSKANLDLTISFNSLSFLLAISSLLKRYSTVQETGTFLLFKLLYKGCLENAPYVVNRLDMVSSDRQHYNVASGIPFVTQYIINILSGGDLNVARNEKVTGTVNGINGTAAAWITTNNALTTVDFRIGNSAGAFSFNETTAISALINTRVAIANFSMLGGNIINGFAFRQSIPVFIYTKSPNYSKIHTSATVEIRNGGDLTISLGTDVQAHSAEEIDYIQFANGLKISDCTYFLA